MTCPRCKEGKAMFISDMGDTLCLQCASTTPCAECDTLVEHDFLSGCGTWNPIDPALGLMLYQQYVRTDADPFVH